MNKHVIMKILMVVLGLEIYIVTEVELKKILQNQQNTIKVLVIKAINLDVII